MNTTSSNRAVSTFPSPYRGEATPYHRYHFDPEVREYCAQEQLSSILRVSKCIVVGDIAVGKTCVINRFGYNIFTNNYKATIGVDFDVQKFTLLNLPFNLQVSRSLRLRSAKENKCLLSIQCERALFRFGTLVVIRIC